MTSTNFVIISKQDCPYCDMAKDLLKEHLIEYDEIDITGSPDLFNFFKKTLGKVTVPQIFHGAYRVGGYDKLDWYLNLTKGR